MESFGIAGCFVLRRFATAYDLELIAAAREVCHMAPLECPTMPNGTPFRLSLTNAGKLGWWSDKDGYRYIERHPATHRTWPEIPDVALKIHALSLESCGLGRFEPDNCLINHYSAGESLGAHQDKTEKNTAFPIVSVSIGCDAVFAIGPGDRTAKRPEIVLSHGDVVVMSGPARMAYHEIKRVMSTMFCPLPVERLNFTLRKAG